MAKNQWLKCSWQWFSSAQRRNMWVYVWIHPKIIDLFNKYILRPRNRAEPWGEKEMCMKVYRRITHRRKVWFKTVNVLPESTKFISVNPSIDNSSVFNHFKMCPLLYKELWEILESYVNFQSSYVVRKVCMKQLGSCYRLNMCSLSKLSCSSPDP